MESQVAARGRGAAGSVVTLVITDSVSSRLATLVALVVSGVDPGRSGNDGRLCR
jgi:hypothetical protein